MIGTALVLVGRGAGLLVGVGRARALVSVGLCGRVGRRVGLVRAHVGAALELLFEERARGGERAEGWGRA